MDLLEAEKKPVNAHPWEISRARRILSLVNPATGVPAADLGSGDLYFTRLLAAKLAAPVIAVDANYERTGREGELVLRRDTAAIAPGALGLVTLLDVLEHVGDDAGFLREAAVLLKPGGTLILTVPAHQRLFSAHDVFLKHYRRYSLAGALRLAEGAGLEVREAFYFFLIPYCVRSLQVFLRKTGSSAEAGVGVAGWKYGGRHLFTRLLTGALELDFTAGRLLGAAGIRLPGLSVCAVCRKK